MFLVAFLLLNALLVPLLGGRLGALADVSLRWVAAVLAALALEVIATEVPGLPDRAQAALIMAAYPVAGVFLVANWRVPGLLVALAGAALNFIAIAANGGVMPASPTAMAAAGLPVQGTGFESSAVRPHPRLGFLGDVFAIPASWPLSNVFSVGDVLLALGVAWALHALCGSRLPLARSGRRSS